MSPLTAFLTNILATGNWGDLPILADLLQSQQPVWNWEQVEADAAWLRSASVWKETVTWYTYTGFAHF